MGTQPTGRLINNQGQLVGLYHTVRPTKHVKSVRYVIKQHGTDDDVMMVRKFRDLQIDWEHRYTHPKGDPKFYTARY